MSKTPNDAEWKAALAVVEGEHRQLEGPDGRWCYLCDAVECSVLPAAATLRAYIAGLEGEVERLETIQNLSCRELINRGFREAAEWLDAESRREVGSETVWKSLDLAKRRLRAKADRREGKV